MKLELHILQNFAPANLNRDDTGSPKDCQFGGYRRARISSQCLKRAVREDFRMNDVLSTDDLATRTKRLAVTCGELLAEKGHERERAVQLVSAALEGISLKPKGGTNDKSPDDKYKTQYLLFVPRRIVRALVALVEEHAESLGEIVDAKASKAKKKPSMSKELKKELSSLLEDSSKTPDLALFGRMIADEPKWNVDASCQVAHAFSTHRLEQEFDFYTAVDDFKADDNAGSDMMGTIAFNSSCFYRYAVLDVDALKANMGEGAPSELNEAAIRAFVQGFVRAIPSGKQNSMAAHSLPSYALAIVRDGQPVSLANAFERPVTPGDGGGLIDASIGAVESYFSRIGGEMGGSSAGVYAWADRSLEDVEGIERVQKLEHFYDHAVKSALS